jgi:hypothetical protein
MLTINFNKHTKIDVKKNAWQRKNQQRTYRKNKKDFDETYFHNVMKKF